MFFQVKVVVFILVSAGIVWVSRSALRKFQAHGFYRFFAWEAILALVLFNAGYWFYASFVAQQIVSWLLLGASIYLALHGFYLLQIIGRPHVERVDSDGLFDFEKTTQLVVMGAYRYIRHPLYASLMYLAWGAFLKRVSWESIVLVAAATLFLMLTAKTEEDENVKFFGDAYQTYMRQTKMFIPFLF